MRADAVFSGTVQKGQLKLDIPARWRGLLARYEGRRIQLVLRPEWKGRSLSANAYLWVIYEAIGEWCGHNKEEIHVFMKAQFLPLQEVALPTGELVKMIGSTRKLSTEQFSEYVSRVKAWAAGNGCYVPDPDQIEVRL